MAEYELSRICPSWTLKHWDELDWLSKIKEVQLRELLDIRKQEAAVAQNGACVQCPNFVKHVSNIYAHYWCRGLHGPVCHVPRRVAYQREYFAIETAYVRSESAAPAGL